MNVILRTALAVVVALGAYYAFGYLRERATHRTPSAAELDKAVDDLRARAAREHPELPKSDAMKQIVAEDSARQFATQTAKERADSAASMFWGFYWLNTEARVAYCRQRGVDLAPFTTAFKAEHAAELARAKARFAAAGVDPETNLPALLPQLSKMVDQDMRDVTAGAQVPLAQACDLFNQHAAKFVEFIQLPEHARQALLSDA